MTTRYRIQLASLAVGCTFVFGLVSTASAFELLGHTIGKGESSYSCGDPGCDSCSAKGGGKHATTCASSNSCGCCAGTPILDRMAELTRSVKCRLSSIELPTLRLPCIDLSSLFFCNTCCSCTSCGGGKSGGGKYTITSPSDAPAAGYEWAEPVVNAPPVPIVNP